MFKPKEFSLNHEALLSTNLHAFKSKNGNVTAFVEKISKKKNNLLLSKGIKPAILTKQDKNYFFLHTNVKSSNVLQKKFFIIINFDLFVRKLTLLF